MVDIDTAFKVDNKLGPSKDRKYTYYYFYCSVCYKEFSVRGKGYLSKHSGKCRSCCKRGPAFYSTYRNTKSMAKFRKIFFNITFKEFLKFTEFKYCHYCGGTVKWTPHFTKENQNGVGRCNMDRKDSLKGYTLDNIVISCLACNVGKSNIFSYEEFLEVIKILQQFRGVSIWSQSERWGTG